MAQCPRCGAQNQSGKSACWKCWAPLPTAAPPVSAPPPAPSAPAPPPKIGLPKLKLPFSKRPAPAEDPSVPPILAEAPTETEAAEIAPPLVTPDPPAEAPVQVAPPAASAWSLPAQLPLPSATWENLGAAAPVYAFSDEEMECTAPEPTEPPLPEEIAPAAEAVEPVVEEPAPAELEAEPVVEEAAPDHAGESLAEDERGADQPDESDQTPTIEDQEPEPEPESEPELLPELDHSADLILVRPARRGGRLAGTAVLLLLALLAVSALWYVRLHPRRLAATPASTAAQYLDALVSRDTGVQQLLATDASKGRQLPGWFVVNAARLTGKGGVSGKTAKLLVEMRLTPVAFHDSSPLALESALAHTYAVPLALKQEHGTWRVEQQLFFASLRHQIAVENPKLTLPEM